MTKEEISEAITEAVKHGVGAALAEGNVTAMGEDHRRDHEFVRVWRVAYEGVQRDAARYTILGALFLVSAIFVYAGLKSFGVMR